MEKFDFKKHWEGFLNNKIVVNCPTEELAKEFLDYCQNEQKILWTGESKPISNTYFELYKCNTCYSCRNKIKYSPKSYYKNDYIIVEFTGFKYKWENIIDYNKIYTLQEIFELNSKFKNNDLKFIEEKEIGNQFAAIYYINRHNELAFIHNNGTDKEYKDNVIISLDSLNMKFQILKEVKYMTFQEAYIELTQNRKDIFCDDTNIKISHRQYSFDVDGIEFTVKEIESTKWRVV